MTVKDWIAKIRVAMSDSSQTDYAGKTSYETFGEFLADESSAGNSSQFLDAFLSVATDATQNGVEWWNRFFNLLESFKQLDQRFKLRLTVHFEPEWPVDDKVRAIMIRQLAAYGCKLNWDLLAQQPSFIRCLQQFPLFIADAQVWSGEYERAEHILFSALKANHVDSGSINKIIARWSKRGVKKEKIPNPFRTKESLVEPIKLSFFKAPAVYSPLLESA